MYFKPQKNKCRQTREWLSESVDHPPQGKSGWLIGHIAQCPRCQKRMSGYARISLGLSLMKSQPHDINLMSNANQQAIKYLKRNLRDVPKANELKHAKPKNNPLNCIRTYSQAIVNAAACVTILFLMKIGVYSTFDKVQTKGQNIVMTQYDKHLGDDSTFTDNLYT
ncbi:MAG: hypothetical protein K9M57_04075 [Phycisphaerae bacterium]|nr:hypothetical protein [Phycisphaerae bacterium]